MSPASAEPDPADAVEVALAAQGDEDPPAPALLEALAEARLLVMIELEEGVSLDDPEALPDGTPVALALAEIDGVPHVPVFTSLERLAESGAEDEPALEIGGAELASGWPVDIPMALNPGSELGMAIAAEEVRSLAAGDAGPAARSISAGTEIHVDDPVTEPQATMERVSRRAQETPGVLAAHRAVFTAGRDSQPQLAIGIELADDADEPAVLRACADAAGPGVALLPVRNPPANPIDAWMSRRDAPFFRRG